MSKRCIIPNAPRRAGAAVSTLILVVLLAACEAPPAADLSTDSDASTAELRKGGSADLYGQLAAIRSATAPFHRTEAAQAAGYGLIPGLDHCFGNPPVGAMGYHYIDGAALDLTLEVRHPEAMVYAPGKDGKLHLASVEYIVPAADWDAAHDELPAILGRNLHLNEALGVYVLHAWVWMNNPAGMFEDWNPEVRCP